jgi:membrane peptidoglycan carboxypeptidase
MEENGFITAKQALEAKAEPLRIRPNNDKGEFMPNMWLKLCAK